MRADSKKMHLVLLNKQFQATTTWSNIIARFRQEVELKCKRRFFRTYDQCFSGREAVQWLSTYAKYCQNQSGRVKNLVKRANEEMADKLFKKFMRSDVVVCVWTRKKINCHCKYDQKNLYRFTPPVEDLDITGKLFRAFVVPSPSPTRNRFKRKAILISNAYKYFDVYSLTVTECRTPKAKWGLGQN